MVASAIVLAASDLAPGLADVLQAHGIASIIARDEYDAMYRIRSEGRDLILIDLEASGASHALRAVADESLDVTVLALAPSDDADAMLRAFAGGAHSCASRSCGPAELTARVDALLRRPSASRGPSARVIQVGAVTIDAAARSVAVAGEPLPLAPAKFDVLLALARARGGVVSHARLVEACRWSNLRPANLRGIVADLRREVGLPIRVVPRVGYVLPIS